MTEVFQIALPGFEDEFDEGADGAAFGWGDPTRQRSDLAQTSRGSQVRTQPDFANDWERDDLLTFRQAARILGMSLREFRRMVDRNTIHIVRMSDWSPRVRPIELQRYIDAGGLEWFNHARDAAPRKG